MAIYKFTNLHIYKLLLAAWLLLIGQGAWAGDYVLSPEREQQFMYHWVAARHALDHSQYAAALAQLLFCEQLNPQEIGRAHV